MLALRDPAFQGLSKRLQAMFFLATPHHGAHSAQLISRILNTSLLGGKPFVKELHADSPTIQEVNDDFKEVAKDLQLYSFFETKPTTFAGLKSVIIVEKTSAIMGLPGERTAYLDADHRGVCKFDLETDPNYVTVRNAFVEALDKIRESCKLSAFVM